MESKAKPLQLKQTARDVFFLERVKELSGLSFAAVLRQGLELYIETKFPFLKDEWENAESQRLEERIKAYKNAEGKETLV